MFCVYKGRRKTLSDYIHIYIFNSLARSPLDVLRPTFLRFCDLWSPLFAWFGALVALCNIPVSHIFLTAPGNRYFRFLATIPDETLRKLFLFYFLENHVVRRIWAIAYS